MSIDAAPTAKGERTRQRVLDAAAAEFAEHGIAGARVDRIAATARTNKAQLYSYFGSKEGLFDAVFNNSLDRIVDVVPIVGPRGADLADWAVRLYDEYLSRPDLIRLATWHRMERNPHGHLVAHADSLEAHKLDAIVAAQRQGAVRAGDPFDIMALVIAMSMAWSPVSNVYAASDEEPASVHEARRALLREAVAAAVAS